MLVFRTMRHASGDGQKGRQVDDLLHSVVMPDLHLGVQEHEIADGLLVHVNRKGLLVVEKANPSLLDDVTARVTRVVGRLVFTFGNDALLFNDFVCRVFHCGQLIDAAHGLTPAVDMGTPPNKAVIALHRSFLGLLEVNFFHVKDLVINLGWKAGREIVLATVSRRWLQQEFGRTPLQIRRQADNFGNPVDETIHFGLKSFRVRVVNDV